MEKTFKKYCEIKLRVLLGSNPMNEDALAENIQYRREMTDEQVDLQTEAGLQIVQNTDIALKRGWKVQRFLEAHVKEIRLMAAGEPAMLNGQPLTPALLRSIIAQLREEPVKSMVLIKA